MNTSRMLHIYILFTESHVFTVLSHHANNSSLPGAVAGGAMCMFANAHENSDILVVNVTLANGLLIVCSSCCPTLLHTRFRLHPFAPSETSVVWCSQAHDFEECNFSCESQVDHRNFKCGFSVRMRTRRIENENLKD